LTRDSLAVAIEALSWMAYASIGERAALLKAAGEVKVADSGELRQAHRMVMETSRFQNKLDHLITQVIPEGKFSETPHGVRSLLRIVAYSRYVDGVREREIERMMHWARQALGWKELRPYEESIARLATGRVDLQTNRLAEPERVAVETCHPNWYVDQLIRIFGRTFALQILKRDLYALPTYVRMNTLKADNEGKLAEMLQASKVAGVKDAFRLNRNPAARTKLLSTGQIVVQDLGSIVAGLVASPRPGQSVLDVCASPGNKTTHLAAQMQNEGQICSIELSTSRIPQWRREVARTGCSIAQLIRADARTLPVDGKFDVVLVDPPCSNTGVFARNPVAKWEMTRVRVRELSLRQGAILQASTKHVNHNGTLVYCTCSILPEENEFVLETFLKKNPEFRVVPQEPFMGSAGLRGFSECQKFYPHLHDCNGYFIAKMQREA
jgi:16S rRNA (cytosine967-C5)-methyltransferase